MSGRRLRILTWHVHGTYLWYLAHIPHELYLPTKPGRPHGYGGRTGAWPWPANVHEVPVDALADLDVDVVLYQSNEHWLVDRHELLTPAQRGVPQVVLEHDPPRRSPTDTRHPVDDPDVTVVHVTHFNQLMWDNGASPTRVVEHGVRIPDGVRYDGRLPRGIVVVNGLASRGRRLGADVFDEARRQVPLDLVGMASEELGGLGEVSPPSVPEFLAPYRFYFHPVRYTSLGLSICEAMAVGLPIVGLATTELASVIRHGIDGFVATDLDELVEVMRRLLDDAALARSVGQAGRAVACRRFAIDRFVRDWNAVFAETQQRGIRPRPANALTRA
jgi:hypothetical protein